MMSADTQDTQDTSSDSKNTNSIGLTLPNEYYNILVKLKNKGIISSYAAATRDALIEWIDNHKEVLEAISDNTSV